MAIEPLTIVGARTRGGGSGAGRVSLMTLQLLSPVRGRPYSFAMCFSVPQPRMPAPWSGSTGETWKMRYRARTRFSLAFYGHASGRGPANTHRHRLVHEPYLGATRRRDHRYQNGGFGFAAIRGCSVLFLSDPPCWLTIAPADVWIVWIPWVHCEDGRSVSSLAGTLLHVWGLWVWVSGSHCVFKADFV